MPGSVEPGKISALVLRDGDPLAVTTVARLVRIDARAMPMLGRPTLLRDRYRPTPAL